MSGQVAAALLVDAPPARPTPRRPARPSRFLTHEASRGATWALGAAGFVVLVGLWWAAAASGVVDRRLFPTPLDVARKVVSDGASFYLSQAAVTGGTALRGFAIGTATALLGAAVVAVAPRTRTLVTQVALVAQCVPGMAIGPVLMLLFGGRVPGVVIGAVAVHVVVLIPTLAGLHAATPAQLDLVRAYGGSRWTELVVVRTVTALPAFLAGLQIAVPCAIIGALVGEYLGGVDSGIGVAMALSQGVFEKTRTWSLGLLTVALTLVGLGVVVAIRRLVTRRLA